MDYQKNTVRLQKMSGKKNKETKPKYVKKEIRYCLKCGGKNENIIGIELENKIGQQKSTCVVCDSRKSTFFKTSNE